MFSCPIRERLGAPCPSCGLTRSLILTLHGDIWTAVHLNLAGPAMVAGALLLSGTGLFFLRRQLSLRIFWRDYAQLGIGYAIFTFAALISNWLIPRT